MLETIYDALDTALDFLNGLIPHLDLAITESFESFGGRGFEAKWQHLECAVR